MPAGPEGNFLSSPDDNAAKRVAVQHFRQIDQQLYEWKRLHPLWDHLGAAGLDLEVGRLAREREAAVESLLQFGITPQEADNQSSEWQQEWAAARKQELRGLAAGISAHLVASEATDTISSQATVRIAADSQPVKAKRGPKAKMERHRDIADVVRSFGPKWKEHLEQIAKKLDKLKIPSPPKWANRECPARSWTRAVANFPNLAVKALEYSLKMAVEETPVKL